MMQTSLTSPLQIAVVSVPGGSGLIALSLCPGKHDPARGWRRDLELDLAVIRKWGAEIVVTLVEDCELKLLQVTALPEAVARHGMRWLHLPIRDGSVPRAGFEQQWRTAGATLRSTLRRGGRVFVHCRGGLGRAGMISARILVELGMAPDLAIAEVRRARNPGAIEPPEQEAYVRACRLVTDDPDPITDRALGCLLGLAVGDAVGTTLEFARRDAKPPLTDMVGGGPFGLRPGEWTDDTSMALCLADSLIARPDLDERDLMERFVRWWREGHNSHNGSCFDIGNATCAALRRFVATGNPIAGSTDPMTAGNGSIMRLAPLALAWANDAETAADVARRQSLTTHAAPASVEGSAALAVILVEAMTAGDKAAAIRNRVSTEPSIHAVMQGSWRGKRRGAIQSSGYVVHTLEAALWCVDQSDDFAQAVLLAANLADDADTVAAVTGQIAGAVWGRSGIPQPWLERLAWREEIEKRAHALLALRGQHQPVV